MKNKIVKTLVAGLSVSCLIGCGIAKSHRRCVKCHGTPSARVTIADYDYCEQALEALNNQ